MVFWSLFTSISMVLLTITVSLCRVAVCSDGSFPFPRSLQFTLACSHLTRSCGKGVGETPEEETAERRRCCHSMSDTFVINVCLFVRICRFLFGLLTSSWWDEGLGRFLTMDPNFNV